MARLSMKTFTPLTSIDRGSIICYNIYEYYTVTVIKMTFANSFSNLFVRNKKSILFFIAAAVLCMALSFVDFALCSIAMSVVSITAVVLFFKIIINEMKSYYSILKSNTVNDTRKLYINTLITVSLALILVGAIALGAFAVTFMSPAQGSVSDLMIDEDQMTEEQKQLIEDTEDALTHLLESAVKNNYGSPILYISIAFILLAAIVITVTEVITAVTIAYRVGWSPIPTILLALLVISIAKDFISSLSLSLISFVAPGINGAINEIASFMNVSGHEENSVQFIYDMAKTLPNAMTLVKMFITTTMCNAISAITDILVSLKLIKKK